MEIKRLNTNNPQVNPYFSSKLKISSKAKAAMHETLMDLFKNSSKLEKMRYFPRGSAVMQRKYSRYKKAIEKATANTPGKIKIIEDKKSKTDVALRYINSHGITLKSERFGDFDPIDILQDRLFSLNHPMRAAVGKTMKKLSLICEDNGCEHNPFKELAKQYEKELEASNSGNIFKKLYIKFRILHPEKENFKDVS